MKSKVAIAMTLLLVMGVGIAVSQQPQADHPRHGILGLFKKGQAVAVKDAGFNYELTVYAEDAIKPLGHTVIEITDDYVVIRDLPGITDTAIPLGAIKSVATVRLRGK